MIKIMLYVLFLAAGGCSLGLVISVQIVSVSRPSLSQLLTAPQSMYPITDPIVHKLTVGCVYDGVDLHTIYSAFLVFPFVF